VIPGCESLIRTRATFGYAACMKGRWLFCLVVCMTSPLPCFAAVRLLFGSSPLEAIAWTVALGALISGACVSLLMRSDAGRSVKPGRAAAVVRAVLRFVLLWFVFFSFIYVWLNFVPIFLGWFS